VHGEETFLVERALAVLRRRFENAGEWRIVWGDDDESRVADALASLASRGLFGGSATVLLRRAEAMRAGVEAAIEATVSEDRYDGRLILAGGALDRRKRWYTAVRPRAAELVCLPVTDPRELRAWVERLASEHGVKVRDDAIAELTVRCGPDLAVLEREIDKLAIASGSQAVGRETVERLVAGERSHAVEELTDRLTRGDRAGALRVLRSLLAADEPPLRIVGFLAANIRRALHVAEEQERGGSPEAIATRLGMPDWLVRRQLGRGPAIRLERALDVLAELDVAFKSSRPEAAVFEAALDALAASAR
jgi:DNA polymerase-3 subunit delta